jgi:membrane protease YdiL (CAAX protease family)
VPQPRAGRASTRGPRFDRGNLDGDGDEGGDTYADPDDGDLDEVDLDDGDLDDAGHATGPARWWAGLRTVFASDDPDYVRPEERDRPWWGMGDMIIWMVVAWVAAAVAYFVVAGVAGYAAWPSGDGSRVGEAVGRIGAGQAPSVTKTLADMELWITALLQVPLWLGFLGGPLYAARRKGFGLKRDFGFTMEWRDVPLGLVVGVATQIGVVWAIYRVLFIFIGDQDVSAQARQLTDRAHSPLDIAVLLLIVGVGAPVFEELFFRGLSQRAITRRAGPVIGVVGSALFFAFVHGQVLQFPALLVFGLILGWMARRYGRLGPGIWAHIGFNLVTAIALIWNLNLP